jgi:hypothetical protein
MENVGLRPFKFCPFFDLCDTQVDWFYVTETCIGEYKTCETYRDIYKKEVREPLSWRDRVYSVYSSIGLDDYFSNSDWMKCPFFGECDIMVSFEDLENMCADKYATCRYFMKQASQKKRPEKWWGGLHLILKP